MRSFFLFSKFLLAKTKLSDYSKLLFNNLIDNDYSNRTQ